MTTSELIKALQDFEKKYCTKDAAVIIVGSHDLERAEVSEVTTGYGGGVPAFAYLEYVEV